MIDKKLSKCSIGINTSPDLKLNKQESITSIEKQKVLYPLESEIKFTNAPSEIMSDDDGDDQMSKMDSEQLDDYEIYQNEEEDDRKAKFKISKKSKVKDHYSLKQVKEEFSHYLDDQTKKKEKHKGAFNHILMSYLVEELDKSKKVNLQKPDFNENYLPLEKKESQKGLEQMISQQKDYLDMNKKKRLTQQAEDVIRFDLGEVSTRKRREVEDDIHVKMEREIMTDNSLTDEEKKLKLDNIKNLLLVSRVNGIIDKTKKFESAKFGHLMDKNFAIFKNLDTYIETKDFWKQLHLQEEQSHLIPQTAKVTKKINNSIHDNNNNYINDSNHNNINNSNHNNNQIESLTSRRNSQVGFHKQYSIVSRQSKSQEPIQIRKDSKQINSEVTESISDIICKSQKYLENKISSLSSTKRSIGGPLLQGLEKQYINTKYIERNLEFSGAQSQFKRVKYAPLIANDSDHIEIAFYNQLNEQIIVGDFKKEKKLENGGENLPEKQNNQEVVVDILGRKRSCEQIIEEYRAKAQEATNLLLHTSKNILKDKIKKMESANQKSKHQRHQEMTQQHSYLKSLQQRIQEIQKSNNVTDIQQNQSIVSKEDTLKPTVESKSYEIPQSNSLFIVKQCDISSAPSLELPKINNQSTIIANKIKVSHGDSLEQAKISAKNPIKNPNQYKVNNEKKNNQENHKKSESSPKVIQQRKHGELQDRTSLSFLTQSSTETYHAPALFTTSQKNEADSKTEEFKVVTRPRYQSIISKDTTQFMKFLKNNEESKDTTETNLQNKNNQHQGSECNTQMNIGQQSEINETQFQEMSKDTKAEEEEVKNKINLFSQPYFQEASLSKKKHSESFINKVRITSQPFIRQQNSLIQEKDLKQRVNQLSKSKSNSCQKVSSSPNQRSHYSILNSNSESYLKQDGLMKQIYNFKRLYKDEKKIMSQQISDIQKQLEMVSQSQQPQQLESLKYFY